jgi:hypothetical protein
MEPSAAEDAATAAHLYNGGGLASSTGLSVRTLSSLSARLKTSVRIPTFLLGAPGSLVGILAQHAAGSTTTKRLANDLSLDRSGV